jgi:hypothetical protein
MYGQLIYTLVMDLMSHGPVPRERPIRQTKHTKSGRRARRKARAKPPRKANTIDTISIKFVDASIPEPELYTMHYLEKIVSGLVGQSLHHGIPWGHFEGGVFVRREDFTPYRMLEYEFSRYEFSRYETMTQTWLTTKAYDIPSIT